MQQVSARVENTEGLNWMEKGKKDADFEGLSRTFAVCSQE